MYFVRNPFFKGEHKINVVCLQHCAKKLVQLQNTGEPHITLSHDLK